MFLMLVIFIIALENRLGEWEDKGNRKKYVFVLGFFCSNYIGFSWIIYCFGIFGVGVNTLVFWLRFRYCLEYYVF